MIKNLDRLIDKDQVKIPAADDCGAFGTSRGFESSQLISGLLTHHKTCGENKYLDAAKLCADWYVKKQIHKPGHVIDGAWVTPGYGNNIIFPEVIEILGGIFDIYESTGDKRYRKCIERGYACFQRAKIRDAGRWGNQALLSRIHMDYDLKKRRLSKCLHRAIDDGIDYRYYKMTGDNEALKEFRKICDAQMLVQSQDGGFYETYYSSHHDVLMVCGARWSLYWAARPFLYAYDEFSEEKYLQVVAKSCRWLAEHQNKDGSYHAWYYPNGNIAHNSIDPCSPAAAIFLWAEFEKRAGKKTFRRNLKMAMERLIAIKNHGVRSTAFLVQAYYSIKGTMR